MVLMTGTPKTDPQQLENLCVIKAGQKSPNTKGLKLRVAGRTSPTGPTIGTTVPMLVEGQMVIV